MQRCVQSFSTFTESGSSCAGGYFDPLNLASEDGARAFKLKEAELKHGRLAMIAFLGEPSLHVFLIELSSASSMLELDCLRNRVSISAGCVTPVLLVSIISSRYHAFSNKYFCDQTLTVYASCAGFGVQALATGEGALGSLAKFGSSFAPELVEDIEKAVGAA